MRQGTDEIDRGKRYDAHKNMIVYKEEWKVEDDKEDKTTLGRMGQLCLEAMNSVA